MIPSPLLLRLLLYWLAAGAALFGLRLADFMPTAEAGPLSGPASWWWAGLALAACALIDAARQRRYPRLSVTRTLPHSLALGAESRVRLTLGNGHDFDLTLQLTELLPEGITSPALPIALTLRAGAETWVEYLIVPSRRGDAHFGATGVRVSSRWRLWQRSLWRGEPMALRVYPNFAPIARLAMLGLEHQLAQLGAHLQPRRGAGSDFQQLREFREGDAIRQIDWKATARYRKPISRDYQDERDQSVVFMLDCGRRLRARDGAISHFDHALNALLLTAYVALRHGDSVAQLSFAGQSRWWPPVKGQASINTLLNQVYDLECGTEASDYLEAARQLLIRQRKRALVILITHLQEEDRDAIGAATRLLEQRHLVMVANLRDGAIDAAQAAPVHHLTDALTYCAIADYHEQRRRLLQLLQSQRVIIADALPAQLHGALLTEYLRVKRSGRL